MKRKHRDKDDYSFRREVERRAEKEHKKARKEEERRLTRRNQKLRDDYKELKEKRGLLKRISDAINKSDGHQ